MPRLDFYGQPGRLNVSPEGTGESESGSRLQPAGARAIRSKALKGGWVFPEVILHLGAPPFYGFSASIPIAPDGGEGGNPVSTIHRQKIFLKLRMIHMDLRQPQHSGTSSSVRNIVVQTTREYPLYLMLGPAIYSDDLMQFSISDYKTFGFRPKAYSQDCRLPDLYGRYKRKKIFLKNKPPACGGFYVAEASRQWRSYPTLFGDYKQKISLFVFPVNFLSASSLRIHRRRQGKNTTYQKPDSIHICIIQFLNTPAARI